MIQILTLFAFFMHIPSLIVHGSPKESLSNTLFFLVTDRHQALFFNFFFKPLPSNYLSHIPLNFIQLRLLFFLEMPYNHVSAMCRGSFILTLNDVSIFDLLSCRPSGIYPWSLVLVELNMLGHSDVVCHLKSIQLITLIEDPSFSRSGAQCRASCRRCAALLSVFLALCNLTLKTMWVFHFFRSCSAGIEGICSLMHVPAYFCYFI